MPDAVLIATSAAASAAVAGLVLRELQHSRKSLEDRVQLAVEAKVGSSLLAFRDLESQLRERVTIAEEMDKNLRSVLESGEQRMENLQQLLDRATEALPEVEDYSASVPALIVLDLHQTTDPREKTVLLGKLLAHPAASAGELEAGGDVAREELLNDELAIRLYRRSIEVQPNRLSARAELLRLESTQSGPQQSESFRELVELAFEHPDNRIVLGRALDAFVAADDYSGMKEFVESHLADEHRHESGTKIMLWRNLAIAKSDLGEDFESVSIAYEKSLELARSSGDRSAFVNSARPYIGYLLRRGKLEKGKVLVSQALEFDPTESQVYLSKAEIEWRQHDFDRSRKSLTLAHQFGNPTERAIAASTLQKVQAAELLRDDLAGDDELSDGEEPFDSAGDNVSGHPDPGTVGP